MSGRPAVDQAGDEHVVEPPRPADARQVDQVRPPRRRFAGFGRRADEPRRLAVRSGITTVSVAASTAVVRPIVGKVRRVMVTGLAGGARVLIVG